MFEVKIIHSRIKAKHNLGFLKTDGSFHHVRWGKHEEWASDYVFSHDWVDEENEFEKEHFNPLSRDFLVYKKNFVLLNCPCDDGELFIIYHKMNKKQKEFLLDYLIKLKDNESIKKVMDVEEY